MQPDPFSIRLARFIIDFLLIALSSFMFSQFVISLPLWFVALAFFQVLLLWIFSYYHDSWRFLPAADFLKIILVLLFDFLFRIQQVEFFPLISLFSTHLLLLLVHRQIWSIYLNPETRLKKFGEIPIIIYGAGTVSMHLLREMRESDTVGKYQIEAILDNDPKKIGMRLGPYKVQPGSQIKHIVKTSKAKEIWFTMPVEPTFFESIVKELQFAKVSYKIVPRKVAELIHDIRAVSIEDLIQRPEIQLEATPLQKLLAGKRILITGAAGSIGHEIAKQVLGFSPARLVLLDYHEHGIYQLEREWGEKNNIRFVVADIREPFRLMEIFQVEKPEILFHAAAYKHVPLMEENPTEAIRTNILGTWQLLRRLQEYMSYSNGKKEIRFVNISTDKAVQPTSMMGLTKRIAELIVYNMALDTGEKKLKTVSVRFGNVLGSSGSVVPLFWDQIRRGGPVTVTHPEMERFFMSIPEAVHLVLHSLLEAEPHDILALDMGEPVKIVQLAERMITLAGFTPYKDIDIEFTGIRPGEKLKEDLFWAVGQKTKNPYLYRSSQDLKKIDVDSLLHNLAEALKESHSLSWWKDFLSKWA